MNLRLLILFFLGADAEMVRAEESRVLNGHAGSVLAVAFSPDGNVLATGSRDTLIKLWDPRTGELKQTLTDHTGDVYDLDFSSDGKLMASCGKDKTIRLWDAHTFKAVAVLEGHTD